MFNNNQNWNNQIANYRKNWKEKNVDFLVSFRKQFESNIPHCPCHMPGTLQSHRRLVQPRPSGPSEPPGPSLLPGSAFQTFRKIAASMGSNDMITDITDY